MADDPRHAPAPAPPAPPPLRRPAVIRQDGWLRRNALAAITLSVLAMFLAMVVSLVVADLTSRFFHFRTLAEMFQLAPGRPALEWYEYLYTDKLLTQFAQPNIIAAVLLSVHTSLRTLILVFFTSPAIGYALSRYRFPGHALADTIVDLPIVVPPLAIGVSLLVFFASGPGRWLGEQMEAVGLDRNAATGIVLCQFLLSAPFAIRAAKSAFDAVDPALEDLARTLGCTRLGAFHQVALPLARNGLVAGCIMAWSRAVGLYGPLMVFVGCVRRKSEVLPTTIYLEVSTGGLEVALAATMVMIGLAGGALVAIHALAPGRKWWGP